MPRASLLALLAATLFAQDYDLVIRNGRVLDGTGNPWFLADIGVRAGRIAAIGNLAAARATRTVDASGKYVTPGYIDMHSHSDRDLADPARKTNRNMVAQGITISVVNQDGRSPNSIKDQKATYEKQGIGNHAILMAGHGSIRGRVLGNRIREKVTPDDVAKMRALVDEAMKDGAWGLSAGLEYVPGRYSETAEIIEMTRAVKPYQGIYISHERSEGRDPMWKILSDPTPGVDLLDAVRETIEIGRATGVPVVGTHLKAKGANYWGSSRAAVNLIRRAREEGLQVYADQYPYETSGTDGNTVLMPLWALAAPGANVAGQIDLDRNALRNAKENLAARLKDPPTEAKIRGDIGHEIERRGGANRVVVWDAHEPKYKQKTISEIAADLKVSPVDAVIWLQRNGLDGVAGGARMRGFSLSEDDLEYFMQQDFMATCTDGSADMGHPRSYGSYPRKIRRYALDRGAISLPHAIRSMTSLPAQILGLRERGRIDAGYWADLVVFDPARIRETAEMFKPEQYPEGVDFVFVDGVAVIDAGKPTGATPGKVLTPGKDGRK